MKLPISVVLAFAVFTGYTLPAAGAPAKHPNSYSTRILGRWVGPRKLIIFHANGTYGIQRNEDAPEDTDKRCRWRIEGDELILGSPPNEGGGTITFFSPERFITEVGGHKEVYNRES